MRERGRKRKRGGERYRGSQPKHCSLFYGTALLDYDAAISNYALARCPNRNTSKCVSMCVCVLRVCVDMCVYGVCMSVFIQSCQSRTKEAAHRKNVKLASCLSHSLPLALYFSHPLTRFLSLSLLTSLFLLLFSTLCGHCSNPLSHPSLDRSFGLYSFKI